MHAWLVEVYGFTWPVVGPLGKETGMVRDVG